MKNLKAIKQKINSIEKIHKITSAMEVVSIAKSKKAMIEKEKITNFYNNIKDVGSIISKEFKVENIKGVIWMVITSDLGLVGGYNNRLLKLLKTRVNDDIDKVILIGNKSKSLVNWYKKGTTTFYERSEFSTNEIKQQLALKIVDLVLNHNFGVTAIYMKQTSQIDADVYKTRLLPINEKIDLDEDYEVTTSYGDFTNEALYFYFISRLEYLDRESNYSEQTSRRVSMENASNNGEEMLKDLRKTKNRTRQAKITQEIAEITTGSSV